MKRVIKSFARFIFFVTYPILIVLLIVGGTVLVIKMRELDSLNNTFAQATSDLNQQNQNKEITIEDLKGEFTKLNEQNTALKAENASLKSSLAQKDIAGYGTVEGKIFPVISGGAGDFSQYQRVCAESTKNKSVQTCRTVSALDQSFVLSLPVGTYNLYAEIYPQPVASSPLFGKKAYYTEYVKCSQTKSEAECDKTKLNTPAVIEVKAGTTSSNINPVDWRI